MVSDVDVNRAISARLLSCHTKMKNLTKKQLLKTTNGAAVPSTPQSSGAGAGSPSASTKSALEGTPPNKTPRRRQKKKTPKNQAAGDDDNSGEEVANNSDDSQEDMFS